MSTQAMTITPVRTSVFHAGDDLVEFIVKHVHRNDIGERALLAITSKIVSLAENCLVPAAGTDKKSLILKEADHYLGQIGHGVSLTIKHGLMLPAAGIDESNSEHGDFIVYPQNPYHSAEVLRKALMKHWSLNDLGVLLTDSRSAPLRLGVVGAGLAFSGFHPVKNMIGEKDIFGKPLKITKINYVDSLAAAAVLMMGEAAEQCPLAIIKNTPVEFAENPSSLDLQVSPEEDMYLPLYQHMLK